MHSPVHAATLILIISVQAAHSALCNVFQTSLINHSLGYYPGSVYKVVQPRYMTQTLQNNLSSSSLLSKALPFPQQHTIDRNGDILASCGFGMLEEQG